MLMKYLIIFVFFVVSYTSNGTWKTRRFATWEKVVDFKFKVSSFNLRQQSKALREGGKARVVTINDIYRVDDTLRNYPRRITQIESKGVRPNKVKALEDKKISVVPAE